MKQILVYGSCVGRDAFEYFDKKKFTLTDYIARQSLISTFAKPLVAQADQSKLSSPFQIRNLQGDLDGNLLEVLKSMARESDYILWDLTDERLGLIDCGNGRLVTRSVELVQSGILDNLDEKRWIKFGSDEHFQLWRRAVPKFFEFLRVNELANKIILLDCPWAAYDELGRGVPQSWSMLPVEANNIFARYKQVIDLERKIARASVRWSDAVADSNHKWTLAPYHYTPSSYFALVRSIERHILSRDEEEPSWADLGPQFQAIPSEAGGGDLCIEFEAKVDLEGGKNILISLDLDTSGDFNASQFALAKSANADIGYFTYVATTPGQRRYFAQFRLPDNAHVNSVRIRSWNAPNNCIKFRDAQTFNGSLNQYAKPSAGLISSNYATLETNAQKIGHQPRPASKAFILTTRFSLYLPNNAAWYTSNGSKFATESEYLQHIYRPERMNPRLAIFLNWSLPLISRMAEEHDILHKVQYSPELPSAYLRRLEDYAAENSFLHLELVEPDGSPRDPHTVKRFFEERFPASDVIFGDARLDDDDLLSVDFCSSVSQYLTEEHVGFAVSMANGFTGLYENGSVRLLRTLVHPKIAIGLMTIGHFDHATQGLQRFHIGSHPTVDERFPTILDSRSPSYVWMRHLEQDSVVQLDPLRSREIIEHAIRRHRPASIDKFLKSRFPGVPLSAD